MPRHAEPGLEDRILDAAQKLWIKGGAKALTMRAVARAAATTTPTVYQRFQNRQDILRGLLLRIRQEIIEELEQASSPVDLCRRYLQFGLAHPQEYELFFAHGYEIFHQAQRRARSFQDAYPGRELARRKLAEWLGGSPEHHTQLHLALWGVLHGTVMLLNSKTVHGSHAGELRRSCAATVKLILSNASGVARPPVAWK
jgi:AcrR family transcriptional regulator